LGAEDPYRNVRCALGQIHYGLMATERIGAENRGYFPVALAGQPEEQTDNSH
jgi:hypothetical protein